MQAIMLLPLTLAILALLSRALSENISATLCHIQSKHEDRLLSDIKFRERSCFLCYNYTHISNFKPGMKINETFYMVEDDVTISDTFKSESAIKKWKECCNEAAICCGDMTKDRDIISESDSCPAIWDGWMCWPKTPQHTTLQNPCPRYIRFGTTEDVCGLTVSKTCEDGRWAGHPANLSRYWTDYSTCSIHHISLRKLYMRVAAYAVTAVAVLPALVIFLTYRQLHGNRISLHKNLFISLLFNAVFGIWFQAGVMLNSDDTVLKQNSHYCKVLLLLTKYFRLTNYMWMFCEGFYLHRLISNAFAEEKSLRLFYAIGWGFPVLPITVYAVLRNTYSDNQCWALPAENIEWVLYVPSLLSLLVNVVFLVNIIRVLVIKLRGPHLHEPSQYRKAVKATLVLVPLFGLHFGITIYRPQSGNCQWQELYAYVDILLDGLQGAAVALIFCYINGEIHTLLRRSYRNFVQLRNPSLRTGQFSVGSTVTTTQTAF